MSEIQPWQWPVDEVPTPKIIPFSRSLDGVASNWEALLFRLSRNQLRLRPAGSEDSFCICDSEGDVESPRLAGPLDPWQTRMICADAFTNSKVARLFYLNSSGRLREPGEEFHASVAVRANGQGLWSVRRDTPFYEPTHYQATFQLFADAGISAFMRRPALDVWHQLEKALANPQSDASFARHWVRQTEREREAALWNWPGENRVLRRAELEDWLRCVLLCQDALWQENEALTLSVPDPDNIWLYGEEEWQEHPIPAELRHMVEQLWRHFAPFNDKVLQHECAYAWKQNRIEAFQAEVREPTAHERLEAMLRWRDWQEQHGE